MKITDIKKNKTNNRYTVDLDGAFGFALYEEDLAGFALRIGMDLSEKQVSKIEAMDEKHRAVHSVAAVLEYGLRSQTEIIKKLRKKQFSNEAIDYAIKKCAAYGLVNDQEVAESFISSRQRVNGWGPGKIRSALYAKGISRETIEQAMEDAYADFDEMEQAVKAAKKKQPEFERKAKDAWDYRRRVISFLIQRGFSSDIAKDVADLLQNTDDNEDVGIWID